MMRLAQLTLADEVPLATLPNPDMSENYAWCGYDPQQRVGFFCHLGRWSLDRQLWREQMYVYLPDKSVLAFRGFGRGDTARGPAAGVQRQICLEPGKRWSIHHHGPVQHLDAADLVKGPALEPFVERLELDLEFTGDLAPFFYPGSDNTTWGNWHYEQVGSLRGRIAYDGREYQLDGFAFRDHTRGPRDLKHFCGSNWIQGRLPDGRGFALFQTWDNIDGRISPGLCELTLTTADAVETAQLIEYPAYESLDDLNRPLPIVFESSAGRVEIAGEPQNTMIFSASSRHEILLGAAWGRAPLVVAEQPLLLRVDGETGIGHAERCRLMETEPALKWV